MRGSTWLLVGMLLAGLSGEPALANSGLNDLYIVNNDGDSNLATLTVTGSDNLLSIVQRHDGLGGANSLSVNLDGDLNGGPLGSSFDGLVSGLGLTPGHIEQAGHGNAITVSVTGTSNLFAMSQMGSGNTLSASITGSNNQVAVRQAGAGNSVSLVQNGNGNILSVVQQSR